MRCRRSCNQKTKPLSTIKINSKKWFLNVVIHHHSGIDGGYIWGCKILPRIFVFNHDLVDVFHWIDCCGIGLASYAVLEFRQCLEG